MLGRLGPGSDLDARGTELSEQLLDRVVKAFRDKHGEPVFGHAWFSAAKFTGAVQLAGARFTGGAWFDGAIFAGSATFTGARVDGDAVFDDARFTGAANFDDAEFAHSTWFDGAEFTGDSRFRSARFGGDACFATARFRADATFDGARLGGDAQFIGATFDTVRQFGPVVIRGSLVLDSATFGQPLVLEAAATSVSARYASFAEATLRLRYAPVVLDNVTSTGPLTLIEAVAAFTIAGDDGAQRKPVPESLLIDGGRHAGPALLSLRGVDASRTVLVNVDLSRCRFAEVQHLDQLHFEGNRCRFADPPAFLRVGGIPVWRNTSRQILAEEWDWRTQRPRFAWPAQDIEPCPALDPGRLLTIYRQLRKAQEDAKNEPGAADFYYGEMEMRRRAGTTPAGERLLLVLYWALSGYGLRATRALSALLIVLALATVGFATVGFAGTATIRYLPVTAARPGAAVAYRQVSTPGPHPGWIGALTYSVDSSTSLLNTGQQQPLTGIGNAVQILLRLLGPLFLALALLAVRNRVKR